MTSRAYYLCASGRSICIQGKTAVDCFFQIRTSAPLRLEATQHPAVSLCCYKDIISLWVGRKGDEAQQQAMHHAREDAEPWAVLI